jgi:hypothetical protein
MKSLEENRIIEPLLVADAYNSLPPKNTLLEEEEKNNFVEPSNSIVRNSLNRSLLRKSSLDLEAIIQIQEYPDQLDPIQENEPQVLDYPDFPQEIVPVRSCCSSRILKLATSALVGIGTGMAMMPIFNNEVYELDEYGVHVHENSALFDISTVNTLVVVTASSAIEMYRYMSKKTVYNLTEKQQNYLSLAKVASVISASIPTALLWDIEMKNREVDGSTDFDTFILWAIICTLPLLASKSTETYSKLQDKICNNSEAVELDSIGSKLVTYGITALAAIARGISYSVITSDLIKTIGADKETADLLGVVLGGLLANSISTASEYSAIKNLFKKNNIPMTGRNSLKGIGAAIEGMWFSLPTLSAGLKYVKIWNPLIKGLIFTPYFVSKTVREASGLYKSFNQREPSFSQVI